MSAKTAKKCVCERKIEKLPYVISKPGQYCLCKDFVWDDSTQAAITILNVENVVLNFNQKKITNNTPTTLGVIAVQNSTNVELINIHLQGINGSRGIVSTNSNNLHISKFQILDFNPAIQTFGGDNLVISNFYIKNASPVSGQRSIFVNETNDVNISDGTIINGRLVFQTNTGLASSQQVVVEKLKINNSLGILFGARALQSFGYNNVLVKNNELIGANDVTLIVSGPISQPIVYSANIVVENNLVYALAGRAFQAQQVDGMTLRNNQLKTVTGNGSNFNMVNRALIDNNNISGQQIPIPGGIAMTFAGDQQSSYFNTAKNNFVSGYAIGYSDNSGAVFAALCTTFFENVATGNTKNFDLIHPTTISIDNISGCEIAPIPDDELNFKEIPTTLLLQE